MESSSDASQIDQIVDALSSDEVVAIPTDTVYGLAANPKSARAMQRLFELKQRPEGVPIAVLVGSTDQASELIEPTSVFSELAHEHWPGALTIVARSADGVQLQIGDTTNAEGVPTVGVRVPDHRLIRDVATAFGPIAATSANVHGTPTITDPATLRAEFGAAIEVIIDAGMLEGVASTVVDISGQGVVVLRQGAIEIA